MTMADTYAQSHLPVTDTTVGQICSLQHTRVPEYLSDPPVHNDCN